MQSLSNLNGSQATILLLLSPPCLWLIYRYGIKPNTARNGRLNSSKTVESLDPVISDPSLLKKHSTNITVEVEKTGYHYPGIRIFYKAHPHQAKLPQLPLLVFVHGLGGSVAQFNLLLTSLSNFAPCLAVDFPGCGRSSFAPRYWDAYSTNSLVRLLAQVVNRYRESDQEVVFICHSMGCSIGALLTSTSSPFYSELGQFVRGFVAICPVNKEPTPDQLKSFRWLLSIPDPIFNAWRAWDARGGTESTSVARFTGPNAELALRKLQIRFNFQSRTPVFRRIAFGSLPRVRSSDGYLRGAFVGKPIWSGVQVPVLLIAGDSDPVTLASEAEEIARYLGHGGERDSHHLELTSSLHSPHPHPQDLKQGKGQHPTVKLIVFPAPSSHALIYTPRMARPVSNLITHFLSTCVSPELSPGWQLQHMATEGKWDVKNLAKWSAVAPVSPPIAGVFRAAKTLREVDTEENGEEGHTPHIFVTAWGTGNGKDGKGRVKAVVDISHDLPVYDPRGLEAGGMTYRKVPSVSKLPPTLDEVHAFMDVVDTLRQEIVSVDMEGNAPEEGEIPLIAVHCHYGFNRTGFFVVSYMVERMGWPLKDAIDEFGKQRPPGIRHQHFVDELWGRYWDWDDDRARLGNLAV
jgi:pimeloyl-ACP methyl ester carboxylesterase/protein-tyrosine phosphatase